MSISLKEYEQFVKRTATVRDQSYAGLGLCGEAGEVYDEVELLRATARAGEALKKIVRNGADVSKLKNELGDVFWYATKLVLQSDASISEVLEMNMAKLIDRRKNGKKIG